MEKDMTVGNPTKMILDFTVPLFIGNVFQQLYNMADTIIVGKFVGANAHDGDQYVRNEMAFAFYEYAG